MNKHECLQTYDKLIGLALTEVDNMQGALDIDKHIKKCNAYANLANALIQSVSYRIEMNEPIAEKKESVSKEALKPAPKNVEPEEPVAETESVQDDEYLFGLAADQIRIWLEAEETAAPEDAKENVTSELLNWWTKQILENEDADLNTINESTAEQQKQFVDYIQKWNYLYTQLGAPTSCLEEGLSIMTDNKLTDIHEVTPDNIDVLIAFMDEHAE